MISVLNDSLGIKRENRCKSIYQDMYIYVCISKIQGQQSERKQRSPRLLLRFLRCGGTDEAGSEEAHSRLPSDSVRHGNRRSQEVSVHGL